MSLTPRERNLPTPKTHRDPLKMLLQAIRTGKDVLPLLPEVHDKNKIQDDMTILMASAFYGRVDVVDHLTQLSTVDIDRENSHELNALMFSILGKHTNITKLLLERGATVNCQNSDGDNPLLLAISMNPSCVPLLIKHGVDLSFRNPINGRNALMEAIIQDKPLGIQLFIRNGIDTTIVDDKGKSMLDYANKYLSKDSKFYKLIVRAFGGTRLDTRPIDLPPDTSVMKKDILDKFGRANFLQREFAIAILEDVNPEELSIGVTGKYYVDDANGQTRYLRNLLDTSPSDEKILHVWKILHMTIPDDVGWVSKFHNEWHVPPYRKRFKGGVISIGVEPGSHWQTRAWEHMQTDMLGTVLSQLAHQHREKAHLYRTHILLRIDDNPIQPKKIKEVFRRVLSELHNPSQPDQSPQRTDPPLSTPASASSPSDSSHASPLTNDQSTRRKYLPSIQFPISPDEVSSMTPSDVKAACIRYGIDVEGKKLAALRVELMNKLEVRAFGKSKRKRMKRKSVRVKKIPQKQIISRRDSK